MEDYFKPLNGIQRKIAKKMCESARTIPSVTTIREINMRQVVKLKNDMAKGYEKLTYMSFIVYAVIKAIDVYPLLNSKLIDNDIYFKEDINLGLAISIDDNLLVPNIKSIQRKSFNEIVDSINELVKKAKSGNLKNSDFKDGTFTISNSGAFGGEIFTPIINYPESAILGIGRLKDKPYVNSKNEIKVCPMMYFCLTYDHRIINGSVAVSFLSEIERIIESMSEKELNGDNGDK